MATLAHCAYCFESLAASLEKRPALSLDQVEAFWDKYNTDPTTTVDRDEASANDLSAAYKPAAISRLLAPSPGSASSSSLQSASSTPSGISSASSATSPNSSGSNLASQLDDGTKRRPADEKHPLFITWNTHTRHGDKRLRGCIGTFEAQPLPSGLSSYALTSAFDDTRFSPITARELPSLEVAVTLLTDFEPAADKYDWEVGVHGLRLSFMDGRRKLGATYLPDVAREQGWDQDETLASLMRKAGYSGRGSEWKRVDVKVVRYQGKKVALPYGQWREWRDWVDEVMAGDQ